MGLECEDEEGFDDFEFTYLWHWLTTFRRAKNKRRRLRRRRLRSIRQLLEARSAAFGLVFLLTFRGAVML